MCFLRAKLGEGLRYVDDDEGDIQWDLRVMGKEFERRARIVQSAVQFFSSNSSVVMIRLKNDWNWNCSCFHGISVLGFWYLLGSFCVWLWTLGLLLKS